MSELMMSRVNSLVSDQTSRRNKMALIADSVAQGHPVEWKWAGIAYRSRLMVRFEGNGWITCRSFDEDILTTYKQGKEGT